MPAPSTPAPSTPLSTIDKRHDLQRLQNCVDVVLRNLARSSSGRREDKPELVIAIIERSHRHRNVLSRIAELKALRVVKIERIKLAIALKVQAEGKLPQQQHIDSHRVARIHYWGLLRWRGVIERLVHFEI